MSLKAIIDCDVLVYQSSFAAQKTRYTITHEGNELTFMDAKERDDWLKANDLTKNDVECDKFTDVLSEGIALQIAQNKLDEVVNEIGGKYELYLTGKGNYREEVATTKPYKGGRATEKPVHYQAVRDFYQTHCGALEVHGMEADDMIGIRVYDDPDRHVVCTIDKDLNMIAGLHYDWSKLIKYRVSEHDSHRFFLMQLLKGDSTDNIGGLPKFGDKKAERLVNDAVSEGGLLRAIDVIIDMYEKHSPVDDWKDYLNEQGRLLWIKRDRKEPLWDITRYTDEVTKWLA